MRLYKLLDLIIALTLFSSILFASISTAEDTIKNRVDADIDIEFISATDLKIDVEMDVSKIYLTASGRTYERADIQSITNTEIMGAIKYALKSYLTSQIQNTFKYAEVTAINELPSYSSDKFFDEYVINLSSEFFGMNKSVNAYNFINGVLDMGAFIAYDFVFIADPGWNNTYTIFLSNTMNRPSTDGKIVGNGIEWKVENGHGENPSKSSELTVKFNNPTSPKSNLENIDLEFVLDTKNVHTISLKTNVLAKHIDISSYNILSDKITELTNVPSDGIRLFVDNGLISWDDFYKATISTVHEDAKSVIENSPFNQTLDMTFKWDDNTTINSSDKYNANSMDAKPPIRAEFIDNNVNLEISNTSARGILGLINAGGAINITADDVNFGMGLDNIGYDYTGYIQLPENIYLAGENIFIWNQNESISGGFSSDVSPDYNNEEIETIIEIEISSTDLNLLSFFTGYTELNLGLYIQEERNYKVTKVPDVFYLPKKVSLDYMNSDAFRLCVEEDVFKEQDIDIFLNLEKLLFEKRMKNILSDSELEIEGHINREAFDTSLALWDGNIGSMDNEIPVETVSFANTPVPLPFHISFLPPEINITNQNFSFKGLQNQSVTYKIIFPHGIDSIEYSDDLDRAVKGETIDGRAYLEISFDESESGLTNGVTCKMHPSTLFVLSVFTPCIISFIITILLMLLIYFLRKKRRKTKGIPISNEEITSYEDQDYYVPPPPKK